MNMEEQLKETANRLNKIVGQYQSPLEEGLNQAQVTSNYTIAEWIELIGKRIQATQLEIDILKLQLELLTNLTKKQ